MDKKGPDDDDVAGRSKGSKYLNVASIEEGGRK